MHHDIVIHASWDEEAKVWVAEALNLPGLVTEAETVEKLAEKLKTMIPELVELNGLDLEDEEIAFTLHTRLSSTAHHA